MSSSKIKSWFRPALNGLKKTHKTFFFYLFPTLVPSNFGTGFSLISFPPMFSRASHVTQQMALLIHTAGTLNTSSRVLLRLLPCFFIKDNKNKQNKLQKDYKERKESNDQEMYKKRKKKFKKPVNHFIFKLLKPTGYVMNQQFNIQQLYVLPTLYLCVLYLSENKQRLVPLIS